MSSYFGEHNCEPLAAGESPDHLLHLARLLLDSGHTDLFTETFLNEKPPPPASKKIVEELEKKNYSEGNIKDKRNFWFYHLCQYFYKILYIEG